MKLMCWTNLFIYGQKKKKKKNINMIIKVFFFFFFDKLEGARSS